MGKNLPISQLVLAGVAILVSMDRTVSELVAAAWATAGAVFLGELLWRGRLTTGWPEGRKLAACAVMAAAVYWISYLVFMRPNIVFEARNADPFIRPAMDGSLWLRARAHNQGWHQGVCRFFLNDLRRDGERPIITEESLQLMPGGGELLPPSWEIPIPGREGRYVNLAYIKKGANALTVQAPQFQYEHDPDLPPGSYRFTVSASGAGCRAAQTSITVKYNGGRDIEAFQTP